jgi:arylsulfatase A-like enzyme
MILKGRKTYSVSYHPDKSPVQIQRVILITIDTLRADHLGCYGYPRPTSPFLDSIAQNSILFQKAFASMATTTPSHASIMTSLYPLAHKVFKNSQKLDKLFLTLAEILSDMNFKTAGYVSTNTHFKENGLDQGFSTFDEPSKDKHIHRRPADKTIERAIKWLDKRGPADKFFLWIHVFDPHRPYNPLPQFRKMLSFSSEKDKQDYLRFLRDQHHTNLNFYGSEEKTLDTLEAYDSEVLFVDHQIKRVYEFMTQKGLNHHALWIITSDHGEGLGNHNWSGHGKHIYNEQIHVPLIFHFTDHVPSRGTVETIVEHVDIFPTVLDLTGCSLKTEYALQGISLLPLLMNNGKDFFLEFAFTQRRHYAEKNPSREVPLEEENEYEKGDKFSLQDENFKYILRTEGQNEFYNIKQDPYETRNLIQNNLPECNQMKEILSAKIVQLGKNSRLTPQSVSKETIEKLKSLGYIQ